MKAIRFLMLAGVALAACDKTSAERSRDEREPSAPREESAAITTVAPSAPPAAATAAPSAAVQEEDTPEIADASGAPPAPSAADDAFKDVAIPAGVTIPTEEDYEEKAEQEITAQNFEAELAKIEKQLAP